MSQKSKTQRIKVLNYLREHKRASTLELRRDLGVMSPAPRVQELREMGFNIVTHYRWQNDEQGRPHRQGVYVLFGEGEA